MHIVELKKSIPGNCFDYQRLKAAIVGQSNPRRFIGQLIKRGYIVRVKKGLYVWAVDYDIAGYSPEILSNLIYGPSYISLEYALSLYGLIPEQVKTVTAVTFKKKKLFKTPVGQFEYLRLYKGAYSEGISLYHINQKETCLMASPEKALLDYIALRVKSFLPRMDLSQLLYDDLRCDKEILDNLRQDLLIRYGIRYRSKAVRTFIQKVENGECN